MVTANPSNGPVGTPITFTVEATETHAQGALHYEVTYGDGASASNVTPEFCTAGPGQPASQTWSLTHQYPAAGHYSVVTTLGVNCSPDTVTVTLTVNPT